MTLHQRILGETLPATSPTPPRRGRWRGLRPAQGTWIVLARGLWLTLVIFTLAIFGVSLPVYLAQLQTPCAGSACAYQQLSPEQVEVLKGLGFSTSDYATYTIALTLAIMTVLGQFRVEGRNFVQGAASFCNYAFQMSYKHPRCTHSHTLAKLLLPAFVGGFLDLDVVSQPHKLVDELAVQALAMRCQLALLLCVVASGGTRAATGVPTQAVLAVLLQSALLVVVLRIVGPPLPIHFALEPQFSTQIRRHFFTEHLELNSALAREDGQG